MKRPSSTSLMVNKSFQIAPVRTVADVEDATRLIRTYVSTLEIDLTYQDIEGELAAMPGQYAPPAGEFLLARDGDGTTVGCIGLRPLESPRSCELKRLYVAPDERGAGLGEALVVALVAAAERIGYHEMKLDTLPSMFGAQALYRKLGFEATGPYYDTPVFGTLFMRRRLDPSARA